MITTQNNGSTHCVQRPLPIAVKARIPMLDVKCVRRELSMTINEVEAIPCGGSLPESPWCWDIGLGTFRSGNGRRELRFLERSIVGFKETGRFPTLTFSQVLAELMPHSKPFLKGTELQRMFLCESEMILRLIAKKELERVKGSSQGVGPQGSPVVTRESVVEFLKARRV